MPKNNTPANSTPNFINNLIRKHKHPKMMEMFVYASLIRYSEEIAEMPREDVDEQMELGAEWFDCAITVLDKIDKKFPGRDIT